MSKFFCQIYDAGKPYFPEEPDLEQLLRSGKILKDSPTTCAALVTLPCGKEVFLKRNNNKSLRFTLRYIFRKARVFRAAQAAIWLEEIGIPTPQVYLAAEYRKFGFLKAGYIATDTIPGICAFSLLLRDSEKPGELLETFFDKAAEFCARLHRNNLEHGDLKLVNFYWDGTQYGIWDLDSVRRWENGIPQKNVDEELSRIISFLYRMKKTAIPEEWQDHYATAKRLTELYQKYAPELYHPTPEAILTFAEKRLRRKRP